ncbi:putative Histidine kinase a protein [Candidatus Zixiibacteriota bacterium]|nr:putative Histidine kinase a protein [candidate division Zixibacteria bacterium]
MPGNPPEKKAMQQFEIMREIALSAASGADLSTTAEMALRGSGQLVGLSGASLLLWDDNDAPFLNVTFAENERQKALLKELEEELFSDLRRSRKLVSAYLSFGGPEPLSTFTLPIKKGDMILGAVIGVQPGKGTLVKEDFFLEALTAALSVAILASGIGPSGDEVTARIRRERLNAIVETATTVNHEINNPLTAVLGNIQLLLMRGDKLDDELRKKLKAVEESALRIKEVTQKLMKITEDRTTEYTDGIKMIDLSEESDNSS